MNNKGPFSNGSFYFYICQKNLKKRFTLSFIPAIAWLIIVTVLLLMPGDDVPNENWLSVIYFDKWVHAGLFGGLTFFFSLPLIYNSKSTKKLLIIIAILSFVYGVLMEFAQRYIAIDRDFDLYDMLADGIGSLIAFWLMLYLKRKFETNKSAN